MMDDSSDESLDHSTFETSDPVSETNEEKEVTIHSVRFQDDNVTHNNVRFQDDLAVMGSKPAGRPSRMEDPIATPTETDEEDNERLAQERANALQGMERLQRQMAQYLGRIKPDHDHTAADSCDNDDDKNVAIVDFVPTPTFKKELAKKRSRSRSKSRSFSSKGMKEKTQPSSVEEDNEELAQELQNALKDMARLQNQMTQYLDRFKAGMKLPQISEHPDTDADDEIIFSKVVVDRGNNERPPARYSNNEHFSVSSTIDDSEVQSCDGTATSTDVGSWNSRLELAHIEKNEDPRFFL
jgi:hypothetical protein